MKVDAMTENLLEVRDLRTHFPTDAGLVPAVDGVRFTLRKGETLGIVGESGSGKSVTAQSILRLVDPPRRIVSGEILFEGRDLLSLSAPDMRKIRGDRISMIFQEPMTSLNPLFRVGYQIAEVIALHQGVSKEEARRRAVDMIRLVGIPSPESRAGEFPHQLSGGMQQRIMIAMALSCHPRLMIADEPTTALDVTIQAQILCLMDQLKRDIGTAIVYITHDLGVVAKIAQNVAVMYAGKIMEYSSVQALFERTAHPYTKALIDSIPRGTKSDPGNRRLRTITGNVPNLLRLPPGCAFAPRCPESMEVCTRQEPGETEIEPGRFVRCWKYHHE
jgi:oligopeptide/dipeptide ABC transporter ATP-binding protein